VASDFDKLFGDDWPPHDFDAEGGPASLRGRGGDGPEGSGPREGGSFGPLLPFMDNEDAPGDEPRDYTTENENRGPRSLNEKEVKVMGVYMHQEQKMAAQHFVLLRDNRGRRAPIWVGQFEAWAISFAIEGDPPERPMTHDLFKIMLDRMGAAIERVIIDDLWNETFYAKIGVIKPDGETMEIDARPSDAIALALRSHAPIYMAENVLEATAKTE
jgi:bifunctional DNase/RNase